MAVIKKFRIKSFKQNNSIIEFQNVSLSYGNRLILDNINFKINEGQIFGMLGPNGVGKSTIFNLITGLITPKHGKIKINGINIAKANTLYTDEILPLFDSSLRDLLKTKYPRYISIPIADPFNFGSLVQNVPHVNFAHIIPVRRPNTPKYTATFA